MDHLHGEKLTEAAISTPLLSLLEAFIPGFSLLTNVASEYFKVDITRYLWGILVVLAVVIVINFTADKIWSIWTRYCISTAEIQYTDELYNYVMFWAARQTLSKSATQFVVATQTNSIFVSDYQMDDEDESKEEDPTGGVDEVAQRSPNGEQMKILRYTPSNGTHYFRYKGWILAFTRSSDEKNGSYYYRNLSETIHISCLGRNPRILKELIQDAQKMFTERDGNKTIIYRGRKTIGQGDEAEWVRCMSKAPRPLSTVVLDDAQKQRVLRDMQEYLHPLTKLWYSNRGIPYRRGYLMEGPPGTGKSSLCFALAGVLKLRIYVVSLNSKSITEDSLASLFRDLPWKCIVLLEDIDAAGLATKRDNDQPAKKLEAKKEIEDEDEDEDEEEDTDEDDKKKDLESEANILSPRKEKNNSAINKSISLSGFLNIIDGISSSEGRILVMTTNHIEKLDAAIIRPGRVDMVVKFRNADTGIIKGIFKSMYSTFESEDPAIFANSSGKNGNFSHDQAYIKVPYLQHRKSAEDISQLADTFAEIVPSGEFSPAEVQGYLLRYKGSPETAVQEVGSWIEETRKEKKSRRE